MQTTNMGYPFIDECSKHLKKRCPSPCLVNMESVPLVGDFQWRIQDFEEGDSVPILHCHAFFTFQDGLSRHIHALHCYLVHDIVLNFDDDGNLRTTKSIQKVMKSEARLVLLASYTTYPAYIF